MSQPESWTEESLSQLIRQGREESTELEFKGADALQNTESKKAEVGKDVSAFANSAGGTLIYGIEENPEEPHPAIGFSPVDPTVAAKEWLEQVINSRIQPRIQGILINPIELKTSHPGRYAYVVAIPESSTAHQASDKRYYKRFNFQSVAMEDYEVRQTMARASRPSYAVKLSLRVAPGQSRAFELTARVENVSEIVGHDISVVLLLPARLVVNPDRYREQLHGEEFTRLLATYGESSSSLWKCVPSLPPLYPHLARFGKKIELPATSGLKVAAVARVFDQFGLSLTANFLLSWPNFKPVLKSEVHATRMSRTYAGAGSHGESEL